MRRHSLQPIRNSSANTKNQPSKSYRYTKFVVSRAANSGQIDLADIYFNEETRKTHIRNIIDSYFEAIDVPAESHTISIIDNAIKVPTIKRRSSMVAKSTSRQQNLTSTCPQPLLSHSQAFELNKTFLSDQGLPPIFETGEDPEINQSNLFSMAMSYLADENKSEERSRIATTNSAVVRRRTKIIYENEMYRLLQVVRGKSPVLIVKQYKNECSQIFMREQKAWSIISTMNIKRMWIQTALMSCQSTPIRSLKSLLMDMNKQSQKAEILCKITIKNSYDEIMANDNEKLKFMVKQLCRQLAAIQGRIINNKINLSNIYIQDDDILIGQWGHCAILEQAKIGNEVMTEEITPILKGHREWFVTPEYLPPEFLEHVAGKSNYNVWQTPHAIDMWSLGCLLLETFTIVPLWTPHRCQISNRPGVFRRGLFQSKTRDLMQIVSRQRKFCQNIKLHLDRLNEVQSRVSPLLLELMIKMLSLQPQKRPTAEQVMNLLS